MNIPEDLINRCKRNQQTAMAELFGMLAPRLKGICYRYCGNVHDAEDLLQESFIIIFTKISSFKGEGSFEGWATRIAVNTSINWLKKNKLLSRKNELNDKYEVEEDTEEDGSMDINTEELMHNISQLPAGYRTILNLFAIEEYSHKEIGEKLGISESTSRSQYTRAKKALQLLYTKAKGQ